MSGPKKSVVLTQSQHTLSVKGQVLCEALQATVSVTACHFYQRKQRGSKGCGCAPIPFLEARFCTSFKFYGIFSLLLICLKKIKNWRICD